MSLHVSVVSIEGSHLAKLPEVLRHARYAIEDSFKVATAEEANRALNWHPDLNHVAKAAFEDNGWTYVIDPELVLMNDDVWLHYTLKWQTRVIGWVCEGASSSYGLTVFQNGTRIRQVSAFEGKVVENKGSPLPEEAGLDWRKAWQDEVLSLAARIGAPYDYLGEREYLIFHLDESGMAAS